MLANHLDIAMAAIGSLVFCTDCGNLLDGGAGKQNAILTCQVCGASCKGKSGASCLCRWKRAHNAADTSSKTVITRSKPEAFPSALRTKRSEVQTIDDTDVQQHAVIAHTCEKCGREEVRFYTLQLRSADEGSTVFYECECGHKYAYPEPIFFARAHSYPTDGTPTIENPCYFCCLLYRVPPKRLNYASYI